MSGIFYARNAGADNHAAPTHQGVTMSTQPPRKPAMKRLFRKLFPKKPDYEPDGIAARGMFEITIGSVTYIGRGNAHGTYEVWANDEYLGEYEEGQALLEILEHKEQNK